MIHQHEKRNFYVYLVSLSGGNNKKLGISPEEKFLPLDYNKLEVPQIKIIKKLENGTEITELSPVEMELFLSIREIRDLDEINEEIVLDVDVIVIWVDGNLLANAQNLKDDLRNKPVILNPIFLDKIWTPDIYFEEVVSISRPTFMGKSISLVLHPEIGAIVYRARILAKLSCAMDFYYYPADTQQCDFSLKSFTHVVNKLKVNWRKDEGTGIYLHETTDPNFDFKVASHSTEDLPLKLGPGTDYNVLYRNLQFTIHARRKMSYHIVQTYLPSIFFVLVTWLCFMIPKDMFEARVGIAMSTLLTLTAMFSSVRESTPVVSYVKAIDVWMIMCVFFIFSALGAFCTSAWISHLLNKMDSSGDKSDARDNSHGDERRRDEDEENDNSLKRQRYESISLFVDQYPNILLTTGFITFNIIYWSWLLIESNHLNWDVNSTMNNIQND